MIPVAADVLAFLGRDSGEGQDTAQVEAHLRTATLMVKAYTHGRGFTGDDDDVAEDLAAVIVSCTARMVGNPTHQTFMSIDDASFRPGLFNGWTLPELAVLHNYRRRAA